MKVFILSGGIGTRLWPCSKRELPKQFLSFNNEYSLLQLTLKRFLKFTPPEDLFLIVGKEQEELSRKHMLSISKDLSKSLILEPKGMGTAPALCFAIRQAIHLGKLSYNEPILISPSDHLITGNESIEVFFKEACLKLKHQEMVCFGIPPDHPSSAFGYLKLAKACLEENAFQIDQFIEKPSKEIAQALLKEGSVYWNSGMFLCTPNIFMRKLKLHAPKLYWAITCPMEELEEKFASLPNISIDHALMEPSKKSIAIPFPYPWSDLGSWDSVYHHLEKDKDGNACMGPTIKIDTKNCLIFGKHRLVSTIGLENTLIIDHEDILLILKRGCSEKVKDLVKDAHDQNYIKSKPLDESIRPWGYYTILEEGPQYKIKRIHVDPKQKLSVQMHHQRSEHWVVVNGTATVTKGEKEFPLTEGMHVYIPKTTVHALENLGDVPLELIEVQIGDYLGEDDIVRFSDRYGRVQEKSSAAL